MNLKENIRRILREDKKTKSTNQEFSKYKDSKFNSLRDYTLQDIVDNWDSLSDHKNENIKTIKHFINNPDKITDIVYDEKGLEDGYHRLIAAKILKKPRFSYRLVENLQESVRRILTEVRVPRSERVELYKDKNIIVVVPLTHRALQKYAHQCQWCINDDLGEWEDYHKGKHAVIIQRNPKKSKKGITGMETYGEIFILSRLDGGMWDWKTATDILGYDFGGSKEKALDYYVNISNDINNFATDIVYYSPENGIYDQEDNYLWNFNYEITDIPNVTPEVIKIMDDYLLENEEMSLQESIKRILKEEVTSKQLKLLEYVNQNGVLTTIKSIGGYDNLKSQLKGTDWMTRDVMIKTIIDVCKEKGGFSMNELGLEEIKLDESNGLLRNLSFIDKNGIEIVTYEKDDDGNYDEEPSDWLSFNYDSKFRNGNYVLDTIHLYEIFDAVIDTYENKGI